MNAPHGMGVCGSKRYHTRTRTARRLPRPFRVNKGGLVAATAWISAGTRGEAEDRVCVHGHARLPETRPLAFTHTCAYIPNPSLCLGGNPETGIQQGKRVCVRACVCVDQTVSSPNHKRTHATFSPPPHTPFHPPSRTALVPLCVSVRACALMCVCVRACAVKPTAYPKIHDTDALLGNRHFFGRGGREVRVGNRKSCRCK